MQIKSVVAAIMSLCGLGSAAQALDCAPFFSTGEWINYGSLRTQNGAIHYAYPRVGGGLPVVQRTLLDGTRAIGAVPGTIPLTFVFFDRTNHARAVRRVTITYVTEPGSGGTARYAEFYGEQNNLIAKDSIPYGQPLLHNNYSYTANPFLRTLMRTDVTAPRTMIERFCVDPGERLNVTRQQFMREFRSRGR